ncbi:molybdopterin molybdotransferase MoeA [Propionibacterium australiense]|uniref:Molybdopterin molybdenumtransferase n=1 Tax=Propionibacterium australiense TaxID=119981 RepID=A0A383S7H3_9ACTN|nr:gephyrin-like molybdotransferase Glp [Propionibacterium australiense]RLP07606.1 molybdopterin molybdenumtransferase MoeA [Propionibacterium australiense]RLP08384.1 molybdopterin molybdenumtransferase MoeA [Propionibacterium australiense]SYZ33960.1 molybdopterin molybdotransferase [Propionibacterium australiense]VEH88933.1 Molybdopterin molybdenumtransferase [Propionibacterium australiense]
MDEPLSVDEHRALIEARIEVPDTVTRALDECLGLVLARDVTALLPVPPFTNSAMDGFAVRHADVAGACAEHPARLPVIADVPAGDPAATPLRAGTAERIMTGALMPAGADTVVRVEDTDHPAGTADAPGTVTIHAAPEPGANVRHAGEDVAAGDPVLGAGSLLDAACLAAAASVGHTALHVHPRPRVGVLATGSELRAAGEPLAPGQIPDSNSPLLAGLVREAGGELVAAGRVPDDPARLTGLLAGWPSLDLVVTAGGISEGAYEVVRRALAGDGARFHHVAQQPGGPQGVATAQVAGRPTPVLCLPGNPVSVWVSFHVYVAGALRVLAGRAGSTASGTSRVVADAPWTGPARKVQFIPVARSGERVRPVHPLGSGSHLVASLPRADGLAVVPVGIGRVSPGMELDFIAAPAHGGR